MARRWNPLLAASVLVPLLALPSYSWAQLQPVGPPPPSLAKRTPQVGDNAPDFALPDKYGSPVRLSQLLAPPSVSKEEESGKAPWVLLVFYRGYWCSFCNSDLRSLQEHLGEFSARGVRILAISVDPPDVTRRHVEKQGYSFTFLSDTKAEVICRYDLLREGSGPRHADVARPAQFLIDSSGLIRWVHLSEDMRVRTRPEDVLKVMEELPPASSSVPE